MPTKLPPIDKKHIEEVYNYYKENIKNNKQRTENYVIKQMKDFLNLCLYSMHVRKEYHKDFYSLLVVDMFRAFDTYEPSKNVQLFGWLVRLCSQSAYKYIGEIVKQERKLEGTCTLQLEASEEDDFCFYDELFAEEDYETENIYLKQEEKELNTAKINLLLDVVLRGNIEREVFLLKAQKYNDDEISQMTSIKPSTIKLINTRNANAMSKFKKFVRDNNYTTLSKELLDNYTTSKK